MRNWKYSEEKDKGRSQDLLKYRNEIRKLNVACKSLVTRKWKAED